MVYAPTLVTAALPPFTPDVVREWVRLPASGEAATIDLLIKGSMAWAENVCEQPLFGADYRVDLPNLVGVTVRGINARTPALTTTTDKASYLDYVGSFDLVNGSLLLSGASPAYAVAPTGYRLTYRAGYDLLELPPDIKLALLLWIDANYERRADPVREKQTAAESYLRPYKRYSV